MMELNYKVKQVYVSRKLYLINISVIGKFSI